MSLGHGGEFSLRFSTFSLAHYTREFSHYPQTRQHRLSHARLCSAVGALFWVHRFHRHCIYFLKDYYHYFDLLGLNQSQHTELVQSNLINKSMKTYKLPKRQTGELQNY